MTIQMHVEKPSTRGRDQFRVALCGSFRRDPEGLAHTLTALRLSYVVLSPSSVEFVDPSASFVRLEHELDDSVVDIETRHLSAISEADFVWLHAPAGYVGPSASLELGHARALGIPVFTDVDLEDELLRSLVTKVDSVSAVAASITTDPGSGLAGLQSYYRRTAARRGWDGESARDTLLLITEEVGELARAVRKSEGLSRDGGYSGVDAANELADVQLYLVHLANSLGVDLAAAVTAKEKLNAARHDANVRAA